MALVGDNLIQKKMGIQMTTNLCSFEKAVEIKLQAGLSLKKALSDAATENPGAHQFFIDRENDPGTRKGFARYDETRFNSFGAAVEALSASEKLSLGAATRAAAARFPGLHREFVEKMAERGATTKKQPEPPPPAPAPAPQANRQPLKLTSTIKRRTVFLTAPIQFRGKHE